MNNFKKALVVTYFALTSLSTIGLGDYRPVSNYERIFVAMIILFGVMIFSFIMGVFNEILASFHLLNQSFEDIDNLN